MRTPIPLPAKVLDERGHKYGLLLVEEFAGVVGKAAWRCRCECGNVVTVRGDRLRTGRTVSCGCWRANPDVRQAARLKVPARRRSAIARMGSDARGRQ